MEPVTRSPRPTFRPRVEELAAAAGTTIGSTEGLAAENRGSYRRLGLRIAISGEYEALIKLLGSIETAVPPLVLSNLQIHGTRATDRHPGRCRRADRRQRAVERRASEPAARRRIRGIRLPKYRAVCHAEAMIDRVAVLCVAAAALLSAVLVLELQASGESAQPAPTATRPQAQSAPATSRIRGPARR